MRIAQVFQNTDASQKIKDRQAFNYIFAKDSILDKISLTTSAPATLFIYKNGLIQTTIYTNVGFAHHAQFDPYGWVFRAGEDLSFSLEKTNPKDPPIDYCLKIDSTDLTPTIQPFISTVGNWSISNKPEWIKIKMVSGKECECGKDKHNFAKHSDWCPKS